MKKIIAVTITAAILAAALTACDNGGSGSNDTTTTPAAAESTSAPEDTSEPADTSAPESSESTEGTDQPSADGEAAKVLDAIRTAYGDDYLPSMPIDEFFLTSTLGLEEGSFTDFAGEVPMISAHVDTAIIVKAAEGKSGEVKAKLEAYQTYLTEESLQYPMNLAKVNASKVLENGDFLGFIILGKYDEREAPSEDEQAAFAEEQVQIGVDAFNNYFA